MPELLWLAIFFSVTLLLGSLPILLGMSGVPTACQNCNKKEASYDGTFCSLRCKEEHKETSRLDEVSPGKG